MQQVDLNNCDKEPIHIPGTIQPHGMLLSFDQNGVINRASANTMNFFNISPEALLGKDITTIVAPDQLQKLKEKATPELAVYREPMAIMEKSANGHSQFDFHLHQAGADSILEIEPCYQTPSSFQSFYIKVRQATVAILNAETPQEVAVALSEQVQALSDFDRVDIYKFDPDWHGQVIAETKKPGVTSFLGQHFPSTDIPKQARELYKRNFSRLIKDVNDIQAPLLALPGCTAPLDMSFSVLRSVSPIHLEYLRNMQVGASMSISIMRRGELWGLVACHNTEAKFVDFHIRTVCESLAQIASSRIFDLEESERYQNKLMARKTTQTLINHAADEKSFAEGLVSQHRSLLGLLNSSGAVVSIAGEIHTAGVVPDQLMVKRIIDWLERGQESVFACHDLPGRMGIESDHCQDMAGILAVKILKSKSDWIIWFRPEYLQTLKWAGNPNKSLETAESSSMLTPRNSFEVYSQLVRCHSLQWQEWEIEAARDLRSSIADFVYLLEKVRAETQVKELNMALELKIKEVEQAKNLAQDASRLKSQFVANISHELRTPLHAVIGLADMLASDELQPEVQETAGFITDSAQQLLTIVTELLDFSRLESNSYTNDEAEFAPADLINAAINLVKHEADKKGLPLKLDMSGTLPTCLVADSDKINQVLLNLLSNAVKFSESGEISVKAEYQKGKLKLEVKDQGIGIKPEDKELIFQPFAQADGSYRRTHEGLGLGLSISDRLIKLMHGQIGVTSEPGRGSLFWFSVPVKQA